MSISLPIKNHCRCCGVNVNYLMEGELLQHQIEYQECPACGYVQTEHPFWLDEAYKDAINTSDTGIMWRNQYNAKIVLATLYVMGKLNGVVLDCAGGYGILVRLLRDYGVNALWSDAYCQNLLAKGFEHRDEKVNLITVFEAFEHFTYPREELNKLLAISENILLSTELIPFPSPSQDDWWYYGKEHGQHIGFFRLNTLAHLAKQHGKHLISDGRSYHLITSHPINAVYWKIILRAAKLSPRFICRKLTSKTWDDHLLMAGKK